jgi:hypothetical protein
MAIELYPAIIHEGDLSPDAVGDDINETVEVRHSYPASSFSQYFMCVVGRESSCWNGETHPVIGLVLFILL